MKMAVIQPNPILFYEEKNVKTQIKLISEKKKATKQKVKQLQQELKLSALYAKQNKKQGKRDAAEAHLARAFQLADQITGLKRQILFQDQLIDEVLRA